MSGVICKTKFLGIGRGELLGEVALTNRRCDIFQFSNAEHLYYDQDEVDLTHTECHRHYEYEKCF